MADFENKRCQLSINRAFGESLNVYLFRTIQFMSGTTGGTVEIAAKKKLRHMKVKAGCRVRMQPVQYDRSI